MQRSIPNGLILLLCCLGFTGGPVKALPATTGSITSASASHQTIIRVAALRNPPYAFMGPNGPQGLSISVFDEIAAQNHWKPVYTFEPDQNTVFNDVISHQADLGLGGLA